MELVILLTNHGADYTIKDKVWFEYTESDKIITCCRLVEGHLMLEIELSVK